MNGISEDDVMEWVSAAGLVVVEGHTPKGMWGAYSRPLSTIYLRRGMPRMFRVPTILHELQHHARGDNGPQCKKVEDRIDEDVARMLINPVEFALAEDAHGGHVGGIATDLEVPQWVVKAFRRTLRAAHV